MTTDPTDPACAGFPHLKQLFQIHRERMEHRTGNISHETVYAITNADEQQLSPAEAAQAIRNHWHIENRLHRQKDVRMQEDNDRTTIRHAPHNLASLRNLALIILNTATAKAKRTRIPLL